MAVDEQLADRIRASFSRRRTPFVEKRMMGGLCFMVSDKMCLGVDGSRLMVRLDPDVYEESLKKPGCTPMDFTGKPMKGFVFVQPEGYKTNKRLEHWIELALQFNPRAKASKKRQAAVKPSARRPHLEPRPKNRRKYT